MRGSLAALLGLVAASACGPAAADGRSDLLAGAARQTVLADIDPSGQQCRSERTVERWLRELTGRDARSIAWSGGRCRLVNKENPLDAGGDWCGQATIRPSRASGAADVATLEIFFESFRRGRPGKAYAFRARMRAADGWDLARFPSDFESQWTSRFRSGRSCPRA